MNTNFDFDFGAFLNLGYKLSQGEEISSFVFTFEDEGVYVFYNSNNTAKQTIISVMGTGSTCPEGNSFNAQTYSAMLKVGVHQAGQITLTPDWTFFFASIFCFFLLILLTSCFVNYVMQRHWETDMALVNPKYQNKNYVKVEKNNPYDLRALISMNADLRSIMFKEAGGENLDDPEVIKLKKKEEDLKKAKDKKRDLHLEDVENLKDRLVNHLKEIKQLIGDDPEDEGSEDEDDRNLNA